MCYLSRTMKNILHISLFLLSTSMSAQVTLYLKNTTGEKLESVAIGSLQIGNIEADSTVVVELSAIALDSGAPCCLQLSAFYKNEKIKTATFPKCVTFMRTVYEGTFKQSIFVRRDEKGKLSVCHRN